MSFNARIYPKQGVHDLKPAPKPSVELASVSKAFPRARITISDLIRNTTDTGYQALRDISLAIHPGETVGILGRNGAGKSTLLQVIVGTLKPTSGTVTINGRISALLELGAGFNPEWTGRRNSEFYCMIQGASEEELPSLLSGIQEFADIGDFFEEPMRTYSTGMFLRVAFAAAIAIDPEIIIVDEALSVGDARFQNKCFNKFKQLKENGKTIILVTHDPVMVSQFCTRGMVVNGGHLVFDGAPDDAVSMYRKVLYGAEPAPDAIVGAPQPKLVSRSEGASDKAGEALKAVFSWPPDKSRLSARAHYNSHGSTAGSAPGQIIDIDLLNEAFLPCGPVITSGTRLKVAVQFAPKRDVRKPQFGIVIKAKDNTLLFSVSNIMLKKANHHIAAGEAFVACFDVGVNLARGDYFIDIGIAETDCPETEVLEWRMSVCHFTVDNPREMYGAVDMAADFDLALH
jgi:lipopolysaccharide transport system ATP-binding protein